MHQEKLFSSSPDGEIAECLRDFFAKPEWCIAERIVVQTRLNFLLTWLISDIGIIRPQNFLRITILFP